MPENESQPNSAQQHMSRSEAKTVSRRDFLKIAGIAGATIGVGGGLGSLVAACGDTGAVVTTAGDETTTSLDSTTASTSASTSAEKGREIKIGYVTPQTGGLAAFGMADDWCVQKWTEFGSEGVVCGDGLSHPLKIETQDSQSDANRAGQLAGDLIANSGIDVMFTSATPETTLPVSAQCEAMETPCIATDTPSDAWFFNLKGENGDMSTGFKWIHLLCFNFEQVAANSIDMWGKLETNHKVATVWPNNAAGNSYRTAYGPILEEMGFETFDAGLLQSDLDDFTAPISKFKKEGCEILEVVLPPASFTTFWKQCAQQAWMPKMAIVGEASLFPSTMEAIGPIADGITGTAWWHPTYPYKSSLTGETCMDLALDWQSRTGDQWQQPQEHYVLMEWLVDALKRCSDIDDKEQLISAIGTTNMTESIVGPFDFTHPLDPAAHYVYPNCAPIPMFHGQWRTGMGQNSWDAKEYMYNLVIVGNSVCPAVSIEDDLKPITFQV